MFIVGSQNQTWSAIAKKRGIHSFFVVMMGSPNKICLVKIGEYFGFSCVSRVLITTYDPGNNSQQTVLPTTVVNDGRHQNHETDSLSKKR